ncbi:hypothetical protein HPT25_01695 [Bacillus sp. BRMEA1]|uniref:hypothetical protein n=1 Tax=Neobacillus endophyticus TaxID=2738405 RepID=UPI00156424D7|nr:hypothetical protein [Neobacillus endophyticus]NRD76221.1 hypothetical protein [Neobacillus endophyticus]
MPARFRNRDEMNRLIFNLLINFVSDLGRSIPSASRWIELTEQEKVDCVKIKIEEILPIAPGVIAAYFKLNERKYFLITGPDEINVNFDEGLYLKEIEISAPIFLRLVCELGLPVKRQSSKTKIYDEVLFQHEVEEYPGHKFVDLIPYFHNILIFEFDLESAYINHRLGNLVGYLLANNKDLLPLNFPEVILNQYSNLFVQNFSTINYNILTKSLNSVHWRDVFIEIYRCIEAVFHSFSLQSLHNSFKSSLSINDFAKLLEKELKKRPTEEESLITIFNGIDNGTVSLIESIKPSSFSDSKNAVWFYNIRNNIVHSRPIHEEVNFEDEVWETLILGSLQIVEQSHKACV